MPRIRFTPQLQRLIQAQDLSVAGTSVASALEQAFTANPGLKPYILDDQGRLRRHVAVFVDGQLLPQADALGHALDANTEIYVAQALSGG